jgi:hypothetical protein
MAITINNTPNNYEAIYLSSIPFDIQSTFQAEENFKYLFDLYVNGNFTNRIATYPRPDGKGIYSPHSVLQANCETVLDFSITAITQNPDSKAFYYVRLGEQYNPGLDFVDTDLATSFTGYTFSTNISSEFFVGDIITVQKDNIAINPWINGTASVTSLTSNFSIMTDKPRDPSVVFSSNESGSIINVTRLSATSSELVAWNAAQQEEQFFLNFQNLYVLNGGGDEFLTAYEGAYDNNLLEPYPIYTNDWATLDILIATGSFATYSDLWVTYTYYDSNNSVLGTDEINTAGDDTVLRWTIPSGTLNIFEIGGNGETYLNNGTLDHYSIYISLGDATPALIISQVMNYKIIPDCRPYDVVRLAFLNKLGGFDYWNFNLVSRYTSNIDRTQINRAFLQNSGKVLERGRDVIYSKAVENWTINSDFLTDEQALFIRELVESSDVYIIDKSLGRALPVVITDSNWQFKSGLLDGYVQYTVNFVKAYDTYINR